MYEISYTKPTEDKSATYNFKVLRTDDLDKFIKCLNTRATCPCVFTKGHRTNDNITEIFGWLRFDTDEEGEAEKLEELIGDLWYIKKPSTRNYEFPYKWHYLVKVSNQSNDPAQFKDQCKQVCEAYGIEFKDMAVTYGTGAVQNMNAYAGATGMALELTRVNEGSALHLPEARVEVGEYVYAQTDVDGFTNLDDPTDTTVLDVGEYGLKNREELEALVGNVDAGCDRAEWMGLLASIHNSAEDKEMAKDVAHTWSQGGDNFTEEGFENTWSQITEGRFGVKFTGGTLVKAATVDARQNKFDRYVEGIKNAETIDEIKDLFRNGDWKQEPQCSKAEQNALPALCKTRANELLKESGSLLKSTVGEFKPLILVGEERVDEGSKKGLDAVDSYTFDNKFHIVHKKKLYGNINKQILQTTGASLGFNSQMFENRAVMKSTIISGIVEATDYLNEDKVSFELKDSPQAFLVPALHVLTNPLHDTQEPAERQDIVEDFFENIWKGKAEDIIRIIGMTMRFSGGKSNVKINKIHVVAPSNTGKTTFLNNIGFQTIHMKRLVQAMSADKGIGKSVIDGLKASGFLLIDEANKPLTEDMKNMDKSIQLDQFGQGGTQDIKLHFTCLTSTHKTAVRGMSDELDNRLLLVELDDMDYPLHQSSLFINENEAYTEATIQHSFWILKDALTNPAYTKETLFKLIEPYKLEPSTDIDEMLSDLSEEIIATYKSLAGVDGDVVERNNIFYLKRKSELIAAIEDRMGEYTHLDKGKHSESLVKHFMPSATRKTLKINGKPVKYYKLNLTRYYASVEDAVMDEFDMLDDMFE
jgi:hypothetical protein